MAMPVGITVRPRAGMVTASLQAGVQVHGRRAGSGVIGQGNIVSNFRGNRFDFQLHNCKLQTDFL